MLRKTVVTILLAVAFLPFEAQAQTSKDYDACIEKAAGSAVPKQGCIADEQVKQTRRLETALAALIAAKPDKRRQIRDAQRKWAAFRDVHCSIYDSGKVVPTARIASSECLLSYTAQRTTELEKMKGQ